MTDGQPDQVPVLYTAEACFCTLFLSKYPVKLLERKRVPGLQAMWEK